MNEKQLRSSLLSWYREALKGNPAPLETICKAIETLYLFDMVSERISDFSCYLLQNLFEINVLDGNNQSVNLMLQCDEDLYPDEEEVLPF